jgi:two-component system, cell cycle sensor histidine kinase and response regulator CckA
VTSSHPSIPLVTVTVLVVDDRSMARRLASRILSEEGYRVLEADGAEEALEVLTQARGRVDLVVLDVVLHNGDGIALGHAIREQWPDRRLLYMSAFPAEVMMHYGLQTLDVPFLAKPFTRLELVAKVEEALKRGEGAAPERRGRARS